MLLIILRLLSPLASFSLALYLARLNDSLFIATEIALSFSIIGSAFLTGGLRQSVIKYQKLTFENKNDRICLALFSLICGALGLMWSPLFLIFFFLTITRAGFLLLSAYALSKGNKHISVVLSSWFPVFVLLIAIFTQRNALFLPVEAYYQSEIIMLSLSGISFIYLIFRFQISDLNLSYLSIKSAMSLRFLSKRTDIFLLAPFLNEYATSYFLLKRIITIFDMLSDVSQTQVEKNISTKNVDKGFHHHVVSIYRRNMALGLPAFIILYYFNAPMDLEFAYIASCGIIIETIVLAWFGPLGLYANYNGLSLFRLRLLIVQVVVKSTIYYLFSSFLVYPLLIIVPIVEIAANLLLRRKFIST